MNILYRADFALLDRVYTPIANWAHDEFNVRAYQLARFSIVGLIVSAVLRQRIIDHVMDAVVLVWFIWMDSRRTPLALGMANPRRYDQFLRIVTVIIGLFFSAMSGLVGDTISTSLWWLSLINYMYFLSVDERPRKPKEASQKLAMAEGG